MKQRIKYIINGIIRRGFWFNNVFFQDCRKFRAYNTFNTDVVNLGSTSAVHAFNYDGIAIKGANWAMNRNPLFGDYAIIRNYSSFLNAGRSFVIITLCPFSSLSGSYDYLDDRYYSILYPSTIPNYSYVHYVQVTNKWTNPLNHYPVLSLFSDVWHIIVKKSSKVLSEEALMKDAEYKIESWLKEFSLKDFSLSLSQKNKDAVEDAALCLNNIISYCRYKNFTPVIVVPPVYQTLADKISTQARNVLFGSLLSKIEDKGICTINYFDHEEFKKDRTLFKDCFLLNEKGARKFTGMLMKQLGLITENR